MIQIWEVTATGLNRLNLRDVGNTYNCLLYEDYEFMLRT